VGAAGVKAEPNICFGHVFPDRPFENGPVLTLQGNYAACDGGTS